MPAAMLVLGTAAAMFNSEAGRRRGVMRSSARGEVIGYLALVVAIVGGLIAGFSSGIARFQTPVWNDTVALGVAMTLVGVLVNAAIGEENS